MALDAGVFYHLTKPFAEEQLSNVMRSAIEQYEAKCNVLASLDSYEETVIPEKEEKTVKERIKQCRIKFRTLQDVEKISHFLAQIYPEPDQVLIGIYELLMNAVEHGNLKIGYELKSRLILQNRWVQEIERRLKDPYYCNNIARVEYELFSDHIRLIIEDDGDGFEYQSFLNRDLKGVTTPNGRGIAIAQISSFDEMNYSEGGKRVTCRFNI